MPDLIQFECPACAATLRVPVAMAGLRGPCPSCQREIIAPNPETGIGAHFPPRAPEPVAPPEPEQEPLTGVLAEEPVPLPTPEPAPEPRKKTGSHPFADKIIESTPLPAETTPAAIPSAFPSPSEDDQLRKPAKPRRGLAALVCIVCSLFSLSAGFFLGLQYRPTELPPPVLIKKPTHTPAPPVTPPPAIDPALKKAAQDPAVPKPPQNKTSLENAQTTLRAFLEAPDWAARSAYILSPETIRPKMEAYAKSNPDGPTPFKSFSVEHSQVDADSGTTLFIFKVDSPSAPGGIPVAVLETPKGWLVDWESFVEFRDDLFKQFSEGPSDHVGEFHLIVTAPDENSGGVLENDTFASFVVAPPLPGRQKTAFIKKANPAYQRLVEGTKGGRLFAPVLKITKSATRDGRSYLEILSIEANDWRPRGAMPEP